MDFTEIIKAMETMTDAQILSIRSSATQILNIRAEKEREKLIENFKKAYKALLDADILVTADIIDEEGYNETCDLPGSVDGFYFH